MKGFYKKHSDGSVSRVTEIHSPTGRATEKNKQDAPDGWTWFDSDADAYASYAKSKTSLTRRQFFLEAHKWDVKKIIDDVVSLADDETQIEYATADSFDITWPSLIALLPIIDSFDETRKWDEDLLAEFFESGSKR